MFFVFIHTCFYSVIENYCGYFFGFLLTLDIVSSGLRKRFRILNSEEEKYIQNLVVSKLVVTGFGGVRCSVGASFNLKEPLSSSSYDIFRDKKNEIQAS